MQRHMVQVLAGVAVFPLAAVGIAAYLFMAGVTLVAAAIFMLACGLMVAAGAFIVELSRQNAALEDQRMLQNELEVGLSTTARQLIGLEEKARPPIDDAAPPRHGWRDEVRRNRSAITAPPTRAAAAPAPPAEPPTGREELTLWLEPVVELATGNTSHYRAQIGLTSGDGGTVAHDEVMQKADQGDLRASLDTRLVRLVIPVLRRLRQRNPALRIFVPVGRATLGARQDVSQILSLLRGDGNLAGGLVFDIAQKDLGHLDATGVENLARLGRSGAMLCISNAGPGGLDLSALRELGVNYLSFPANAGTAAAWTNIGRTVRDLNIEIVVAAIRSEQQAATAGRLGRYGHGPHFAPPRRVRPDAGTAAAPVREATAA